jgi:hypothetical protein
MLLAGVLEGFGRDPNKEVKKPIGPVRIEKPAAAGHARPAPSLSTGLSRIMKVLENARAGNLVPTAAPNRFGSFSYVAMALAAALPSGDDSRSLHWSGDHGSVYGFDSDQHSRLGSVAYSRSGVCVKLHGLVLPLFSALFLCAILILGLIVLPIFVVVLARGSASPLTHTSLEDIGRIITLFDTIACLSWSI